MVTADAGIELLRSSGATATAIGPNSITFTHAGTTRTGLIRVRQTPPTPWDLSQDWNLLLRTDDAPETLFYVVSHLTQTLRDTARQWPWLAVAAINDQVVLINGAELRPFDALLKPQISGSLARGRGPWGRFAVLRALIRTRAPRTQVELSREAGVSQAAVSQALKIMSDDVARASGGWQAKDPETMWRRFLNQYPGPGGITSNWFGLDPKSVQAALVCQVAAEHNPLVSGDAAADMIAPWRHGKRSRIYAKAGVDLAELGFAETSPERATLEYTVPADFTIWHTTQSWPSDTELPVTDPVLTAWDVQRSGGPDADEAVNKIWLSITRRWNLSI